MLYTWLSETQLITSLPKGGHFNPISIDGAGLLWKNATVFHIFCSRLRISEAVSVFILRKPVHLRTCFEGSHH